MVGSSSSSRSGSANSIAASATRMRQPPENSEQGRCCSSSKPSRRGCGRARRRRMRADVGEPRVDLGDAVRVVRGLGFGEQRARSPSARSTTSIRLSGPSGASCASRPMRVRCGTTMSPCSGAISPAMARNSVVLPAPLRPTRPTRIPSGMVAEASVEQEPCRRCAAKCRRSRAWACFGETKGEAQPPGNPNEIVVYSITSSARRRKLSGIFSPSALAVVRLMTRLNVVGCSTGISPGFAPRKILST